MPSRRLFLASLLSLPATGALLLPPGRAAASLPPAIDARYDVRVAGMTVADLALTISPEGSRARSTFVMRSRGLAALMSDAFTRFETLSRIAPDGTGEPAAFEAYHYKRDRTREISIRYGEGGALERVELVNQGRDKKSEVPVALQAGTVDPLTAFLRLRAWLPDAALGRAPATRVIPVFEGRKRFDLEATWLRTERGKGAGLPPHHELKVRLVALFGFDRGDDLVSFPDEPQGRWLRVLVQADRRLLPLLVETVNDRRPARVTLTEDCRAGARCPALVQ
ncbi:DUF3108 domain-containing protein [Geminicoccaceae bacterium 1502E]|nr:DUF3108 domain-containing protein [Geminicoccaceae bacterium 1502E]